MAAALSCCIQQPEQLWLGDEFLSGHLWLPVCLPLAVDESALLFIALLIQDALGDGIADLTVRTQNNRGATVIVELGAAVLASYGAPLGHLGHEIKDDLAIRANPPR